MAELKPCPFCNCDRAYVVNRAYKVSGPYSVYQVECFSCAARGPAALTEDKSIDAWNKRS